MSAKIELDNQEIIRRYKAGESGKTIGKALGVSGRTILNRLRQLGIPRRYKVKLDTAAIVQRYKAGEKIEDIAKSLNVSESTILNRLKEGGFKLKRGPKRIYDDAEICRMYQSGMEVSEIQELTGARSYATFYAILKRNGVPVRIQRNKLHDPEIRQEVIRLRAQGLTHIQIAKRMGINRNYIGKVLREEVEVDRKAWQPEVRVTAGMSVQELRDNDLTIDEIADVTGLSRVDVFQELQQ